MLDIIMKDGNIVHKNMHFMFIYEKVKRQRRKTWTQDCYIWHHIFLPDVVILYLEPPLVIHWRGWSGPFLNARLLTPILGSCAKRVLLWLPTSPNWPPVLWELKLCPYVIFITPTPFRYGPSFFSTISFVWIGAHPVNEIVNWWVCQRSKCNNN